MTKIRFYVDGLNFYYGIAKKLDIKWIDLESLLLSLVRQKIPEAQVEKIFLFTARVKGNASDRQKIYLNALREHSPCIEIVMGHFNIVEKSGKLIKENGKQGLTVKILTREEKGTDVNIACHIVDDAHTVAENNFDVSCLVSNDSDLACALKIKKRLKQRIILIAPRTIDSKNPVAKDIKAKVPKKDRITSIPKSIVKENLLPNPVGKWRSPWA